VEEQQCVYDLGKCSISNTDVEKIHEKTHNITQNQERLARIVWPPVVHFIIIAIRNPSQISTHKV